MLVSKLLDKNNVHPTIKANILLALGISLKRYYCHFIILQIHAIKDLVALTFTNLIEKKINQSTLINKFLYWFGYVEDILGCYVRTYKHKRLDTFLDIINTVHPKIEFTLQLETDNKKFF